MVLIFYLTPVSFSFGMHCVRICAIDMDLSTVWEFFSTTLTQRNDNAMHEYVLFTFQIRFIAIKQWPL